VADATSADSRNQPFHRSLLRVPRDVLRVRAGDVAAPETLVKTHRGYRNRVMSGPMFRADTWTALECSPDDAVADLARRADCSFSTAWQVAQD
jgi:hypothetical protein